MSDTSALLLYPLEKALYKCHNVCTNLHVFQIHLKILKHIHNSTIIKDTSRKCESIGSS